MKTDVIWRLKQMSELKRGIRLAYPNCSKSVNEAFAEGVIAGFSEDMGRFRDTWTEFEFADTPLVWRHGRIAIHYRFLPPHRIVEILSVEREAYNAKKT
jgi:hypothetical protein